MSDYEITYISDGELAEAARVQLDTETDNLVRDLGGSFSFASAHTPRRLFYPVQKKRAAGLRLLQVDLPAAQLEALKLSLKKQAGLLRFAIIRTPRRADVPQAILDLVRQKKGRPTSAPAQKTAYRAPVKPLTEAEVEQSIEKALTEEVK